MNSVLQCRQCEKAIPLTEIDRELGNVVCPQCCDQIELVRRDQSIKASQIVAIGCLTLASVAFATIGLWNLGQ